MPYILSSTTLRKNYMKHLQSMYKQQSPSERAPSRKAINTYFKGYQAHHIIPRELCNRYLASDAQLADCDQAWNCIMLPNHSKAYVVISHCGSHPIYTEWVDQLLTPKNLQGMQALAPAIHAQIDEMDNSEDTSRINDFKTLVDKLYAEFKAGKFDPGDPSQPDNDDDDLFSDDE